MGLHNRARLYIFHYPKSSTSYFIRKRPVPIIQENLGIGKNSKEIIKSGVYEHYEIRITVDLECVSLWYTDTRDQVSWNCFLTLHWPIQFILITCTPIKPAPSVWCHNINAYQPEYGLAPILEYDIVLRKLPELEIFPCIDVVYCSLVEFGLLAPVTLLDIEHLGHTCTYMGWSNCNMTDRFFENLSKLL